MRRAIDRDVLPAIESKRLDDVTLGDVLTICDRIKGRGSPKMALTTRNAIKRMYEYAIAHQMASTNPAQSVAARFIATQESRTRVLSPDEIGTMLRAVYASDIRRPLKLAIYLLVLTMVRKSELIEAKWNQFDFDSAIWRIATDTMKMSESTGYSCPRRH